MATHRSEIVQKSRGKIYKQLNLSLRKDSGIPDALDKMMESTGIPATTYCAQAIREKLVDDGYLSTLANSSELTKLG